MLEFVEPHPTGGTCYVRITKKQATEHQKQYAKEYHDYTYSSDIAALEEFMALHLTWDYNDELNMVLSKISDIRHKHIHSLSKYDDKQKIAINDVLDELAYFIVDKLEDKRRDK